MCCSVTSALRSSSHTCPPLPCAKPTPNHAVSPASALILCDAFPHSALCFGWLLGPSITPALPSGSLAVALAGPRQCPVTALSSQPLAVAATQMLSAR